MAAFCFESDNDYSNAMRYGMCALNLGERLPEEQRALSMLAYVGDGLIRIISTIEKESTMLDNKMPNEAEIEKKMVDLLGNTWKETIIH